jgi:hypothetical protein
MLVVLTSSFVLLSHSSSGQEQLIGTAESDSPKNSEPVGSDSGASTRAQVSEAYGKLPLSFEANEGQVDGRVKFISRGPGYGLFLTSTEAVLVLRKKSRAQDEQQDVVRMQLLKANAAPHVEGQDELPGKSNYFIGNDPAKWRAGVANYARVQYRSVYPGIDMVYYGNQRQLEYDFVVAPGADPRRVALGFDGVDALKVDAGGDLVLSTAGGEIRQHKPVVYQEVDGARREVAGNYVLKGASEVGFDVGEYDTSRPLVIDPVLVYSTYLGGSDSDSAYSIDLDSRGYAYVTGMTTSDNFPLAKAAQVKRAIYPGTSRSYYSDAFVTKLNAAGTALIYSTYLGAGRAGEVGKGIAADAAGNAYVTGSTVCSPCVNGRGPNDFPVLNAAQPVAGDPQEGFVTKLSPTGALVFSTFLGGTSGDSGEKIVVDDASGDVYVTGNTGAPGFPTTPGAYKDSTCSTCANGTNHGYVAKYNAAGAAQWATLIGVGYAYDIALDSAGNTYLTGAAGLGFPVTPGAFQEQVGGGGEAFVAKLNPQGSDLLYSTFLGGAQSDRGYGIDVDAAGNAYVTGQTQSATFPTTPGAFDVSFNGGEDAFVTKLNATGTELLYSTFLGGRAKDVGRSIGLDSSNNVYVTGQTASGTFPVKNSLQIKIGTNEIFLTRLNAAGSALVYSTFLGTGDGRDVAVTGAGIAFLTGQASKVPVTLSAFQTARNAGDNDAEYDAFVMKVNSANEAAQTYSISGHITDAAGDAFLSPIVIALSGKQNRTTNLNNANNYSFGALQPGTYTVTVTRPGVSFDPPSRTVTIVNANETADFTVIENIQPTATLTSPASDSTFTAPADITLTADASDSDGSVAEVKFYANTMSGDSVTIGTDTTAPYSIVWNDVPVGNYVVSALVTDNLGATAQAENLASIFVKSNIAPTVALTSPANGSTFRARDNIEVTANVAGGGSAAITYVEFFAGTTMIARKTESPYSFTWSPTETGTFSLTARAFDNGGLNTTSSPVTVTINPALTRLYGMISDGTSYMSGVTVTLSGTRSGTVVTGANGQYSFADLPADGQYRLTPSKDGYVFEPAFWETDFLGYYDRWENFRAIEDSPVSARLLSPSWFAHFPANSNVAMTAEASSTAGTISKVEFYVDGAPSGRILVGTDTTSPYGVTWKNAPSGDYFVFAVAFDSTGKKKNSESTPITVDPAPTQVSIHGQVVDGGGTGMSGLRVTLSGSRTAVATTNLYGYYGFGNLPAGGSYTVTAPANYTFTPSSYSYNNLTADEVDTNFSTTSFNTPPTITITSPANGATFNAPTDIPLSAQASDSDGRIVRVTFYARTPSQLISLGSDTSSPYSFAWGVTTPGTYTITAQAVDNGGLRTTSAPITITINPEPQASDSGPLMDRRNSAAMILSDGHPEAQVIDLGSRDALASLLSAGGYRLTSSKTNNFFAPVSWTITDTDRRQGLDSARTRVIQLPEFTLGGNIDLLPERGDAWYITEAPEGLAFSRQWDSQPLDSLAVREDYDGDGKTDLFIYRPSDGNWYVLKSSHGDS